MLVLNQFGFQIIQFIGVPTKTEFRHPALPLRETPFFSPISEPPFSRSFILHAFAASNLADKSLMLSESSSAMMLCSSFLPFG
jgi:hypothetical protein